MWEDLVRRRGGAPLGSLEDPTGAGAGEAKFVAVLVEDGGILPAVAALEPAQAVALLVLAALEDAAPKRANVLLERLESSGRETYLLKSGRVGGHEPGRSIEVTETHVDAILDGIVARSIEWEVDPDFGYRVAASVPGIEGRARFVLIPRFLYARTDRVYEYAALVPRLRRERAERLAALDGLDGAIIDALGG